MLGGRSGCHGIKSGSRSSSPGNQHWNIHTNFKENILFISIQDRLGTIKIRSPAQISDGLRATGLLIIHSLLSTHCINKLDARSLQHMDQWRLIIKSILLVCRSKPDPHLVKQLNENHANRYSFVCNALLNIGNCQSIERLNEVSFFCIRSWVESSVESVNTCQ